MEIKVNIPQNDYVQPKEVRQEVVQHICEAFLSKCIWNVFHPKKDPTALRYRNATLYVRVSKRSGKAYGFSDSEAFPNDVNIRFNGEEMRAAFKALRSAGYHMFRLYERGSWLTYICSKKPYVNDATEVTTFKEFID